MEVQKENYEPAKYDMEGIWKWERKVSYLQGEVGLMYCSWYEMNVGVEAVQQSKWGGFISSINPPRATHWTGWWQ